jgi:hypothetical protein
MVSPLSSGGNRTRFILTPVSKGGVFMTRAPQWTAAECEILKTCLPAEAARRLPDRTYVAIRTARRNLLGQQRAASRPWTGAEDRKLARYSAEPLAKLARRFKGRTLEAVKCRRLRVLLPETAYSEWTTKEVMALRLHWPDSSREEMVASIPNHTWKGIRTKAKSLKIRRKTKRLPASNELREAVRKRAREDGIAFYQLGKELGCGTYFMGTADREADLRKIALAVEFFGGKLVIDWQDE